MANGAARQFAETGKSRFSGLDIARAQRRISDLNAISSLDQISPLKSLNLHKLSGDRKGQWAITINGPWRLVFRFEGGNAFESRSWTTTRR